jgi:hypothetical protein
MSRSDPPDDATTDRPIHREYVLGVRIVEVPTPDGTAYRFEAPRHRGMEFDDPETAALYADVYFLVNGFQEDGTGDRGVPPEILQGGRDALAAYLMTWESADVHWVASFYGRDPAVIERCLDRVRTKAEEIRDGAAERGLGR